MSGSEVVDQFSFGQVVTFSGIKARTLDHWAATGFLTPSIKKADGTGTKRVYSFSDIVAARVSRDLRAAGVSLQRLRRVVRELRKMDFTEPFSEVRLIISGKDVYLQNNRDLISTLSNPGQAHFLFTALDLGETLSTLRGEIKKSRAA